MSELNFIELIEKNPITTLSNTHNNKLLEKIKTNFTESQQQLFISSFYCYLNYDKTTDFVIDLDNVWKWIGFKHKAKAKILLEKHFKLNIDYKKGAPEASGAVLEEENSLAHAGKQNLKHGGQNKEVFLLNIKCFKSFCLKAGTKKADEIHDYYIKLEELIQVVINEETNELKLQLLEKDTAINNAKKEKRKAVEKAIITQFPVNTECIYFGTIDNTNEKKEKLIKFGHTNDLSTRVWDHHGKYDNFVLQEAFKVQNKVEIENLIKTYPKIKNHIRTIEVKGKSKTEIIAYDDTNFTISRLTKHIKDIIHSKTYSIDNFNRIMKLNDDLENLIKDLEKSIKDLKEENNKLVLENGSYKEKINDLEHSLKLLSESEKVVPNQLLPDDDLGKRFDKFIYECCIIRSDVEVDSCDIIAQFRIWNGQKSKRETNERFNTYLRTRFLATRLQNQNKDQCVHGFVGVMLKPIEYKKVRTNDLVETFIFEICSFSPNNRIANKRLGEEFEKYKNKMGLELTKNDLNDVRKYLDECPYVQKGTLYIQEDKFTYEGYYGLALKSDSLIRRKTYNITGKQVQKIDISTESVLNTWTTIAKAAQNENMSASKMSRIIKHEIICGNTFYKITK